MADPELDTGPDDPAPVAPDGPEGAEGAEGAEEAGAASEETVEERMLRAEATVASSDRGLGANDALRAMARAARSFLLYDPSNEAIKTFLGDYRDCCARALTFGTLDLEIRPIEMMLDGECVYLEKDRERSLAFRLYRDGVRRLTIEPEVDWSELLRLLEIMSIRYTGVRQQEDDVVTLLWKAGFKGIDIAAVEGFVPEEDEDDAEIAEARAAAIRAAGGHVEVPSDFDTPADHSAEREYPTGRSRPRISIPSRPTSAASACPTTPSASSWRCWSWSGTGGIPPPSTTSAPSWRRCGSSCSPRASSTGCSTSPSGSRPSAGSSRSGSRPSSGASSTSAPSGGSSSPPPGAPTRPPRSSSPSSTWCRASTFGTSWSCSAGAAGPGAG